MAFLSSALEAIIKRGLFISISLRSRWTGYTKMGNFKWFSDAELEGLDRELCAKLDMAREKAGVPFIITSGKRSPEHNAGLVGSVSDSAHLSGLAVDLATGDDHTKNRVMYGLTVAGLADRVGEYFKVDPANPNHLIPHHIHIDLDQTKPRQVTWANLEKN